MRLIFDKTFFSCLPFICHRNGDEEEQCGVGECADGHPEQARRKKDGKTDSPIFTQHIDYVNEAHYTRKQPYEETEPNQIVVDYIASMTDDYFIDLHDYFFPKSTHRIDYKGYFDKLGK